MKKVIIVGGGHNGLVCACYLAKAGFKVSILESKSQVGGAAVTEEFHPGFRNSVASYTVGLLHPKIIQDLHLHQHGLIIRERPLSNFMPLDDQNHLKLFSNSQDIYQEFSRFSVKDAENWVDFSRMLQQGASIIRQVMLQTPPTFAGGFDDFKSILKANKHFGNLGMTVRRTLLDLFCKSAGDILDFWFENDAIKALFCFDAMVGHFASPYMPGSAYVLLHHVFGEVNGKRGVWGHAIGGMGAISQAMAAEAKSLGVDIQCNVKVIRVETKKGKALGVETDSGMLHKSDIVVANVNPKLLYLQLLDAESLPAEFLNRMRAYKCASGTFRMNVALSELPDFTCLTGKQLQIHHQSGIIIAPSMAYMEKAYFDAKLTGFAKQPIIEMLIPSTIDDSLAPQGQHVASLFCQHFNPKLPNKLSWDKCRDQAANTIIEQVNKFAPNFKKSIIATMALSPQDLETRFGLIGGDIFHGALSLDQLYSARPLLGYADYRAPVKGLYMCGAGTHPGGGVTGAPGHNAAKEIIKDRRLF